MAFPSILPLLVLGTVIVNPTNAFVTPSTSRHGNIFSLKSSLAEPEGETVSGEDLPQNLSGDGVELWLDLRGTAILPSAALSHLNNDLWGDFEALAAGGNRVVDRVLVSEANVQKALQHMDSEDQACNAVDVLFVRDKDGALLNAKDQSAIVGRIFSLKENEMVDPLPAMDTVSRGGWALVDSGDMQDGEKKQDAVNALFDFLSAGATAPVHLLLGGEGMIVEGDEEVSDAEANAPRSGNGGIVLCCQSKVDLLNSGSLIQSSRGGALTTTDSGIIVSGSEKVVDGAPFHSAVAIPFDVNLWKTASFVLGGFSFDR